MKRRNFIKATAVGAGSLAIDWSVFPVCTRAGYESNEFDAIIIGAGLGGLTCAAAFARQGFKPLVLERRGKVGGYASTFETPEGFVFDFSLRATSAEERDGVLNLIPAFPEISDVEFVLYPNFYRAIFPRHDIRVANKDLEGYIRTLNQHFPQEREGVDALFLAMRETPERLAGKSWAAVMEIYLKSPELKAILSTLWLYYGLPPSKISGSTYAFPTLGFLTNGAYYPIGGSQGISNAFAAYVEKHGGTVHRNAEVVQILQRDDSAYGVKTVDGREFTSKVVVSNVSPSLTSGMLQDDDRRLAFRSTTNELMPGISAFEVFLGLDRDLVGQLKITDAQVFQERSYDLDDSYQASLAGNMDACSVLVTLYDNIYQGYSPAGKNTISIAVAQDYGLWQVLEADYLAGNKTTYDKRKQGMAARLIERVEKMLLPGLANAIQVQKVFTPISCVEISGSDRGAIYGWESKPGTERPSRATPIKGLYLSGAWTQPGAGEVGVMWSGLGCFRDIMKTWQGAGAL
jgi:all-trans-retinol 13,14-reductase